jgi:peptidoglycan/xylan/chitin deacetylase (PgdA/CDA1 family)
MKSTAYIISLANSQDPADYMPTSTLTTLQASGLVEIGDHTRNHLDLVKDSPTAFGYADQAAMWQGEINSSRTDLTSQGFTPVDTFAYPYGSYDSQVESAVAGAGFIGARSVDEGYNTTATDKYALKQQHITNTTTFSQVQSWIDYAVNNKVWVILMFHDVWPTIAQCVDRDHPDVADPDCTDTSVLQQTVDYLKNEPANTVVTVHDGIGILGNTVPVDTTAPVITVPSPITVTATTTGGTQVTYTTSATDANPANPVVSCTPTSGSTFAVGSTTVTCTATDAANNTATSTFIVQVNAPAAVNNAPVGTNQTVTTNKNASTTITLAGTDADASTTLTFATTSNPTHGSLSGSGANFTLHS